jgi:hypothetical protein
MTATTAPLLPGFNITTHIPRHSLNIICGPPYSGKSKLIQTAVRTYLDHGEWLGTHAPQFEELGLPMVARLGYIAPEPLDLPTQVPQIHWHAYKYSRINDERPLTLEWLYEQFPAPRPQFLIVDRFQALMPGGKINDYCEVGKWCAHLARWREEHDVTMIGTASTAKVKAHEDRYMPHDQILGAVCWAEDAHAAWMLNVSEPKQQKPEEVVRIVIGLTHGELTRTHTYYDFDSDGRLVPTLEAPVMSDLEWRVALEATVAAHASAEPVRTAQIIEWGVTLGTSRASVERWIADMLLDGKLEKVSQGKYKWTLDNGAKPC